MGYFSNGSEGELYEQRYCSRCIHHKTCPVWMLHLLLNYELCNAPEDNPGRIALDMLIPRGEGGNEQCTMFVEAVSRRLPGLFDEM